MQRQWLNVKGEIIDMDPQRPEPARPRRRRPAETARLVVAVACVLLEFSCGMAAMDLRGLLAGIPFHVVTVIMAALTWSAFKPEALRS